MGECYTKLETIWNSINKKTGCSFDTLNELNSKGKIKKIFDEYKVEESLWNELVNFLNLLLTPTYDMFPYLRKIYLNESEFVQIFNRFSYIIGLYYNNKDVYRKFPLYVKTLVDNYGMSYLKDSSVEQINEILNDRMSLIYRYDPNSDRNLVEVKHKFVNYYTDYDLYTEKIINNKLNKKDKTELFILSEKITFDNEYNELNNYKDYNSNVIVKWVSKNHGDNYGFDILSFDPILKKEKIIEVKSGRNRSIILSLQEFKEINTAVKHNCDYYIYKYYADEYDNLFINRLKYDSEENIFYDLATREVYDISPYFENQNIYKIKASIEKNEEKIYKKIR